MIALVTGGAEGIGKGLAEECAKRGYDLIIASLPNDALDETVNEFSDRYKTIEIYKYGVDFLKENAVEDLFAWTEEKGLKVDALVNNVGLGSVGLFEDGTMLFYELMISLNVRVVTRMTHVFIPHLKQSKKPVLLNVASFAGTVPVPNKVVYAATKAFVLSFTLGLRHELKAYGAKVSALCPGAVITSPEVQKRIDATGFFGRKSALFPDRLAAITFRKMMRGKAVIIPGAVNKLFNFILTVLPLDVRNAQMSKTFK